MKLIITFIVVSTLLSCGNSKKASESPKNTTSTSKPVAKEVKDPTTSQTNSNSEITEKKIDPEEELANKNIEIKAHFGEFVESDDLTINSAEIVGNNLVLSVTYSGGCEKHSFDMVGSQFIAKSLPPIRQLKLIHKNNGDKCRAIITKTITVDVRDMAERKEPGAEIVFNLHGYEGRIVYIFK